MMSRKEDSVLYIFGGEKASGAEIVIERLMRYNAENVEAHLFISPGTFASKLQEAESACHVVEVKELKKLNRSSAGAIGFYMTAIKNYFVISYKVSRYLKKNNISVVHANTIVPASYLIPVILFSNWFYKKRLWIWSDHDIRYYSKLDAWLSKICVSLYSKTLVVSEAVKRKYNKKDNIVTLYNGIDLETFQVNDELRNQFRSRLSLKDDEIILGIAAAIGPRKGQLELIKAFNDLGPAYNAKLFIAGGFSDDTQDYTNEVKSAVSQNEKIVYLGHVSDMISFYNGCDVIVNNSNLSGSEPLGTTIYEAMACEKVSIASNTGGSPEIIAHESDGYLFEADNAISLKECLEYVLTDFAKHDGLRKSARSKVFHKFNITTMAEHYNSVIVSLKNQKMYLEYGV